MVVGSPTKLNLIPSGVMPVVYINQGDAGYDKEFLIYNGDSSYNVPAGVSATIRGKKADGYGVTEAAALTEGSNLVTVTITEQMVAAAGANLYELVFVDTDGLRIATINMVWAVKADALGDAVISDSDLDYATQVMNTLQSVEAFKNQLDTNTDGLAAETAARIAADNNEKSERIAADNELRTSITSETAARTATDTSLQSQINQLVAPTGTAPSAAEIENARITADGATYSTLGEAIRSQVSDLENGVKELAQNFAELDAVYVRGSVDSSGGVNTQTHRIVTQDILCYGYPVFLKCMDQNYRFWVCIFNSGGTFLTNDGWHQDYMYIPAGTYFRVTIAKVTETAVPADIAIFSQKAMMQIPPSFALEKTLSLYNEDVLDGYLKKLFQWSMYSNGAFVYGGYRSISTPIKYPFKITITNSNGELYYFNVKTWSADEAIAANYISTSGWKSDSYTVEANTYFTIEFTRKSSSTPLPSNLEVASLLTFTGEGMILDLDVEEVLSDINTLNFWNETAASYSEYIKRYMAHDMMHKYFTEGNIINAPKYYCHVAVHRLPVGATVDFGDASFKVVFYTKDGDPDGSNYIDWSTAAKYIPANVYFMISAQYGTEITLDEWYTKFNVVADTDIVNQNDFQIPAKNYVSRFGKPDRIQLLWFSDIHADKVRLRRIVDYINANRNSLNDALCTGDMVSNQFSDSYAFWSQCGADDILTIIGNHDALVQTDPLTWASNAQMYSKYFAPYISGWDVTYTADYCNWYKVYNNSVMLIGLCAANSTASEEAEMLSFLNTALNAARTNDYAVLIAHHYPSDPTYTEKYKTPFETLDFTPVDLFIPESVFAAVETFKTNGGEFVCYLTGHTHADLARYRTVEHQIIFTISTAFMTAGIQQNAQYRNDITKYEDLFNILYVDRETKTVSIKRIGSDRDVWFRKLDYLAVNYETAELV